MSRTVVVKVGASIDASMDRVFRTIQSNAKRARVVVGDEMKGAGKDISAGVKGGLDKAERDYRKWTADIEAKGKGIFNPAVESAKQFAAESKSAFRAAKADFDAMGREAEIVMRKMSRDKAQEALGLGKHSASHRRRETLGSAGNIAMGVDGALGFAAGAAKDLLHGAGINTDLMSYVEGNKEIQSKATQLSNAAYIPSESGPAGTRVDPKELEKQARQVGNETGASAADALDGLIAFTEKTGDLDTGRKILKDMAMLSKATGSSMVDTVQAAAAVANQLGDIPNKGQAAVEVMRVFAGQGQKGAIEIRNIASQMGKLAGQANKLTLNDETTRLLQSKGVSTAMGRQMAVLGGLSQVAMLGGGRTTATLATNSAAAFVQDLTSATSKKRFTAAGIDIYGDKGHKHERDPIDIIRDALTKTHGSSDKISALMSNKNSRSVVSGFADTYNKAVEKVDAGHGGKWGSQKEKDEAENAAGLKAVTDQYNSFLTVAMTQEEIQDKFALAMQTSESQVTVFNNKMAEASAAMMDQLRPAILKMLPAVLEVTNALVAGTGKIMSFLGLDQKDKDQKSQSAEAGAQNALSSLNGALYQPRGADGKVQVSEEQLEVAKQAKDKLQAEVDAQSQTVMKDHQEAAMFGHGALLGVGQSKEGKEKTSQDEQKLERMKDTLDKLEDGLKATYGREMLDQLTIIAKKVSAPEPPKVNTSGAGHTPVSDRKL